jgi:hypothetical protein
MKTIPTAKESSGPIVRNRGTAPDPHGQVLRTGRLPSKGREESESTYEQV